MTITHEADNTSKNMGYYFHPKSSKYAETRIELTLSHYTFHVYIHISQVSLLAYGIHGWYGKFLGAAMFEKKKEETTNDMILVTCENIWEIT